MTNKNHRSTKAATKKRAADIPDPSESGVVQRAPFPCSSKIVALYCASSSKGTASTFTLGVGAGA